MLQRGHSKRTNELRLVIWTGQRQGDLSAPTWPQYDRKIVRLLQFKTHRRVTIPVGTPLRLALEEARAKTAPILVNSEGQPWTSDGFRSSWRKACKVAGIVGLTFNDLRGTSVTRLAVAGCTVPEIAAITGHSLRDVHTILVFHYLDRDNAMAESAIRKPEARTFFPDRAPD